MLASYIKEIGWGRARVRGCGRQRTDIIDVLSALDAVGAKFQTIVRDAESLGFPSRTRCPRACRSKGCRSARPRFASWASARRRIRDSSPRSRTRTRCAAPRAVPAEPLV